MPSSGWASPLARRSNVVLPQPLSPTTASDCPACSETETSVTAWRRSLRLPGATNDLLTDTRLSTVSSVAVARLGVGLVRCVTVLGATRRVALCRQATWRPLELSPPMDTGTGEGRVCRQASVARSQRGANAQPLGNAAGFGGDPRIGTGAGDAGVRGSRAARRLAVYGCAGRAITSAIGPVSQTRPAYITTTRSATDAAAARSWVTSKSAHECSRRSRSNNESTCA
ncbi:unannotated protein [freshwater metagenome]|uniref:Unannotated protein n=1 Tax=freshwater metagenome TaxID=449393 RepID=A0A6J7U2X4_9ZZZZ